MSKYTLGRCETYFETRHGVLQDFEKNIQDHIIFMEEYGLFETIYWSIITHSLLIRLPDNIIKQYNRINDENWMQIYSDVRSSIRDPYFDTLNIVHVVVINEWATCVIKTYYLRIIQRVWKNICKKRKHILLMRRKLSNITYKETHGTWSEGLNTYPTLRGMLSFMTR